MFDTQVTVVGNLVAEPRLAFTKDGQPVASFRLASTPRRFDRAAGEWRDGDTLYTGVTCWRGLAENVAASLKKGCSVIVLGRLSVRPYETKDGDKRQSVDIDAIAVGPDLGRAVTLVKRAERGVPLGSVAGDPGAIRDVAAAAADGSEPTSAQGGMTGGATDWGWSSGAASTSGDPSDDDLNHDPRDSEVSEDVVGAEVSAVESGAELAAGLSRTPEVEQPVAELPPITAQLTSAGGRWRSRGAAG